MDETIDLGPCCACSKTGPDVRNILMLQKKCPTPGKGWGCFQCGLPPDGAIAVLCDTCLETHATLRFACRGFPATDGRIPIGELTGKHKHNLASHPEARFSTN
jgi:hypothetical protein